MKNNTLVLRQPFSTVFPVSLGKTLKAFMTLVFLATISLLIFYVLQINYFAKETYTVQNYETQLSQISQETESLEISFSEQDSLAKIDGYLQGNNFQKTSQTRFIQLLESTAVAK
ncbi:MAG: hypothetical protein WC514_02340 [Candidatus Paceibacterota bacterium]